jgi:hypothetical protein
MEMGSVSGRARSLGIASLVFGLLGFGFYWWVPLGMVLSLTGMMMAIVGWVSSSPRGGRAALIIVGFLISAAAMALDLFVAIRGLEIIHLISYR